MSVIDTLVYDRTAADASRAAALCAKKWSDMTSAEQTEWAAGLKGSYNAAALNRVGSAVSYVAARLEAAGYHVTVSPVTSWTVTGIPTETQMQTYLTNIRTLRAAIALPDTTPAVPDDMDRFTWDEANAVEKILAVCDQYITNLMAEYFCCGQPACGQIWEEFT